MDGTGKTQIYSPVIFYIIQFNKSIEIKIITECVFYNGTPDTLNSGQPPCITYQFTNIAYINTHLIADTPVTCKPDKAELLWKQSTITREQIANCSAVEH